MNKELLLKVKAHILEEPRRLNMSEWKQTAKPGLEVKAGYEAGKQWAADVYVKLTKKTAPPCNTVACIAGWTVLLGDPGATYDVINVGYKASQLLGLDSDILFFPKNWPEPFKSTYPKCKTSRDRARLVAKVIDLFIKTNGTF